ncbi:MAG: hypothetical protein PHN37_00470 [Candidatus Pacebacteria bacterium]|nr:hypothetical protein [Candidatus Paceibacterota bacterium]
MFFESEQAREAEKKDLQEQTREKLVELLPYLKELSKELQEQGFLVDQECRIQEREFNDVFSEQEVKKDQEKVKELENKFSNNKDGELLEVIKTLTFNKFWFNHNLVSLRTSKFDDYCNGVDEIIFDLKTKQPLAAVDKTTNPLKKIEKIKEKIIQGSRIKYGFILKENIEKQSLKDLPTFIISLTPEELIDLAEDLLSQKDLNKSEKKVIQSLVRQSQKFQEIASPAMEKNYKKAEEIFKRISL